MPRLVRRKPLVDRIKDYLNPADFLLWLSEEFETRDWDSRRVTTPLAGGLHFVFLIARANAGGEGGGYDDVFGDEYSGTSWMTYIVWRYLAFTYECNGGKANLCIVLFSCVFPNRALYCKCHVYI